MGSKCTRTKILFVTHEAGMFDVLNVELVDKIVNQPTACRIARKPSSLGVRGRLSNTVNRNRWRGTTGRVSGFLGHSGRAVVWHPERSDSFAVISSKHGG